MDDLVKKQWFGIIWYQEWLSKIIRSWVVSIFVGTPFYFFYDFLMYSLIFMNMQIWSLAYFTAEWSCYVLLLFFYRVSTLGWVSAEI